MSGVGERIAERFGHRSAETPEAAVAQAEANLARDQAQVQQARAALERDNSRVAQTKAALARDSAQSKNVQVQVERYADPFIARDPLNGAAKPSAAEHHCSGIHANLAHRHVP